VLFAFVDALNNEAVVERSDSQGCRLQMGVNAWIRLGRVRKSPPVSVLRSFKHNGLGPQVRRGCPAGQCPRSRMRLWCVVGVFVRPPLLMDASRVTQREAEEVFDLSERQYHRVRVSIFQVLIQRLYIGPASLVLPVE